MAELEGISQKTGINSGKWIKYFWTPFEYRSLRKKNFKIRSEMAELEGFSRFPGKPGKIRENG